MPARQAHPAGDVGGVAREARLDERALTLILLLAAAVLPLRELAGRWEGRPERRATVRALWVAYLLVAVGAAAALVVTSRGEDRSHPPPTTGPEQYAGAASSCVGGSARA